MTVLAHPRKQFNRIMEEIELGRVQRLIVAHKDRLVRFGFEWFAAFCQRHGIDLVIVNGDTLSTSGKRLVEKVAYRHCACAIRQIVEGQFERIAGNQ